jgi:hypothetical protein
MSSSSQLISVSVPQRYSHLSTRFVLQRLIKRAHATNDGGIVVRCSALTTTTTPCDRRRSTRALRACVFHRWLQYCWLRSTPGWRGRTAITRRATPAATRTGTATRTGARRARARSACATTASARRVARATSWRASTCLGAARRARQGGNGGLTRQCRRSARARAARPGARARRQAWEVACRVRRGSSSRWLASRSASSAPPGDLGWSCRR